MTGITAAQAASMDKHANKGTKENLMSEEQWTQAQLDAAWAEEALDSLLRRALRNIAWDFTEASMTLEFPQDWQFRTAEPKRPS